MKDRASSLLREATIMTREEMIMIVDKSEGGGDIIKRQGGMDKRVERTTNFWSKKGRGGQGEYARNQEYVPIENMNK